MAESARGNPDRMTPGDNDEKSEEGVDDDNKVAASRAGKEGDDDDGSYVGRTFNDDSLDVGETGAEARSEDGN